MSLQGTLETFAVPDVLSLLAATSKTGELRVDGDRSRGRLWLHGGRVVGADVARAATFADAVFELLRLSAGSFVFDAGATPPRPADPVAVDTLLAEAQARLGEWRTIEAVVPSLACAVRLAPELAGEEATLSAAQWKALVAVAAGGDVAGVMDRLKLGEFDACRTVKELVGAGLVTVESPPPAAPAPAPALDEEAAPAAAPRAARPPAAATAAAPPSAQPPAAARRQPGPQPAPAPPAPRPAAGPANATSVATTRRNGPDPDRRVPPGPAPSLEEAEELVHQLASLRSAPPRPDATQRPAAAAAPKAPAQGEGEGSDDRRAPAAAEAAGEPTSEAGGTAPAAAAEQSAEEPINRGMLLKFLSSVRS